MKSSGSGPGMRSAMPAGDRKIPDPIVDPMTTAVALHRPMRRGRPAEVGGVVMGAHMVRRGTEGSEGGQPAELPVLGAGKICRNWCWCWLNGSSRGASFRFALRALFPACFLPPVSSTLRFLFIPAAAVALIAQLAVLRSVIAGRAPASTPGRSDRWAEVGWVLLPTLVLIAILVLTWNRLGQPIAVAPMAGVQA